ARNGESRAISQSLTRIILSHLPPVFWSVWLAGTLALGLRLLAGLWMARALRHASRLIGPTEVPPSLIILPTFAADTNPKRERGSQTIPSLAHRVRTPRRR